MQRVTAIPTFTKRNFAVNIQVTKLPEGEKTIYECTIIFYSPIFILYLQEEIGICTRYLKCSATSSIFIFKVV